MKKLFTFFLCLSITLALQAQTASTPTGTGTAEDPYKITSINELCWIAASDAEVSTPNQATRWTAHYIQTADINFADASPAINTWNSAEGWTPIGNSTTKFTGFYDGKNHTISGLYINSSAESISQGLFGYIGFAGAVTNIGMTNTDFTGIYCTGSIAGKSDGTVSNCYFSGNITVNGPNGWGGGIIGYSENGTITECYSTGTVNGTGGSSYMDLESAYGGIAGYGLTISNCYNTGSVSGTNVAGGIVGTTYGTISNCYNIGSVSGTDVIGGIIGANGGTISNCYNAAPINGVTNVGSIAGADEDAAYTDNFWDRSTSGKIHGAGWINTDPDGISGKTTAEMKAPATFTGWSTLNWTLINNYYPILKWQTKAITWNGTSWLPSAPTYTDDVTIDATYNDAGFTCNNLTVKAGKQITIASGILAVSGDLTLKSDASNGTATLIDNPGTINVSGTTSVEQYLSSGRNWYVSSPTSGATTAAISNAAYVASYSEPTASWVTESSTLTPLKGYVAVSETANAPITFTGTLNTGNQTNSALTATPANETYHGYNLVGNPYPSYVDWSQATKTNLLTTMWYRTFEGSAYKFYTYNSTGSIGVPSCVTGNIPPMQAFWVKVTAGNTGTLGFTNTMRSDESGSNPLKSPAVKNTVQQLLRLQVSNGSNCDETVIYFNPNASDGYDSYDSPKMSNSNPAIPEIYTLSGTEKVVINGLNNNSPDKELALGFTTGQANSFNIKATELTNFDADTKIILKDYLLNTEQELASGSEYAFTSDVANSNSRFSIIFKSASSITETDNQADNAGINIFKNANGQLTIQRYGNIAQEGRITVCNATGQKLLNTQTTGTCTVISRSFSPGVYLVSVNIAGTITTKKIVIN